MEQKIWNYLLNIRKEYDHCLRSVYEGFGLSRMELDILLFLANNPELNTARDIVKIRQLTKSHVSTALQTLEQKQLIEKKCNERNHKTVYIYLKKEALVMVDNGRKAQKRFMDMQLNELNEDEKAMLFQLLCKMIRTSEGKVNGYD